ncbi:MAG: DUF1538 domain-containing protein [Bacillota bacterium]
MNKYGHIWKEAVAAILPMTVVIVILQLTLVRIPAEEFMLFLGGVAFVLLGMFLFLIGADVGLVPLGRLLGSSLPSSGSVPFFIAASFVLGFVITIAEPDLRVLAGQFDSVSGGAVSKSVLIVMVSVGVGLFLALSMLRIGLGWPIRRVLTIGYGLVLVLALFVPATYLPVSFDSGGVTTGPMTTPFILSLGAGTSAVMQGRSELADGFGLVGMASLGPILAVMLLGLVLG